MKLNETQQKLYDLARSDDEFQADLESSSVALRVPSLIASGREQRNFLAVYYGWRLGKYGAFETGEILFPSK